jgi:flagellar motor switch protein FliG
LRLDQFANPSLTRAILDPLHKAAVLLASLDADAADALIEQMPPELAHRARDLLLTMDAMDPAEQDAVIEEFLRLSQRPATQVSPHAETRTGRPPGSDGTSAGPGGTPFDFLQDADSGVLVAHLQNEHPQTVAVVLSHLPPEKAATLLHSLDSSLQSDVVSRLAEPGQADPEMIREIERGLAAHLSSHPAAGSRGNRGAAAVAAILKAAPAEACQDILDNLAEHHPALAAKLQPPSAQSPAWTFDDLPRLGDLALSKVFSEADPDVLTLALAGAAPAFVERVLDQLPPQEAKLLRHALDHLGPARLSDVEQAQARLVELARRLQTESRQATAQRTLSLTV